MGAENCPTCDRRIARLDEVRMALDCPDGGTDACACPKDCCWLPMGGCSGERVDWRARATAAERNYYQIGYEAGCGYMGDKYGQPYADEAAAYQRRLQRSREALVAWLRLYEDETYRFIADAVEAGAGLPMEESDV